MNKIVLNMRFGDKTKDGSVQWGPWLPAHSFTRNFFRAMRDTLFQVDTPIYASTGEQLDESTLCVVQSTAGAVSYGLVAGTGTTATTFNDNDMETLIAHGTSAGQLEYGATSVDAPTQLDDVGTMTITRDISNNSGDNIVITELGFFANVASNKFSMLIHDILVTPVTITDGSTKTMQYALSVSN
jgi:hypothetical protein